MTDEKTIEILKKFHEKLPKFPDGRIDYTESDTAPVVSIFVKHREEILILKRSEKVSTYQGKWNNIGGYLDEFKDVKQKVLEELREETGIEEEMIASIKTGKFSEFSDKILNKTWLIHPFIVELKEKPEIKLDWEHTEYRWIKPEEISEFDIVPDLDKSWRHSFD